jgi:8-oxo-dGTP pyrophosphatase MutT (NUDIX family)
MIWGEARIETVARIDVAVEAYAWSFLEDRAGEIDAHWGKLRAAIPQLFNGRVMMMHGYRIEEEAQGRVLHGLAFETDFKALIAWRDFGFPDETVINCFAMAALRSADGAFILGRMGDHTAGAGRIYFPAGTPDRSDVKAGRLDLEGSALRELTEETGIVAEDLTIAPEWHLVFEGPRLACMKPVQARLDAKALMARGEAFLAQEKEPELTGFVPVFSVADFDPAQMPAFMLNYLRKVI